MSSLRAHQYRWPMLPPASGATKRTPPNRNSDLALIVDARSPAMFVRSSGLGFFFGWRLQSRNPQLVQKLLVGPLPGETQNRGSR